MANSRRLRQLDESGDIACTAVLQTAGGRVISVWANDYLAWTEEIGEGAEAIDGGSGC